MENRRAQKGASIFKSITAQTNLTTRPAIALAGRSSRWVRMVQHGNLDLALISYHAQDTCIQTHTCHLSALPGHGFAVCTTAVLSCIKCGSSKHERPSDQPNRRDPAQAGQTTGVSLRNCRLGLLSLTPLSQTHQLDWFVDSTEVAEGHLLLIKTMLMIIAFVEV